MLLVQITKTKYSFTVLIFLPLCVAVKKIQLHILLSLCKKSKNL